MYFSIFPKNVAYIVRHVVIKEKQTDLFGANNNNIYLMSNIQQVQ